MTGPIARRRAPVMALVKGLLVLILAFLTAIVIQAARDGRGQKSAGSEAAGRLPVHGDVGEFTLIERTGREISGADLAGQVWVADFIFTRCLSTCPRMTAEMARIAAALGSRPGIRFVSFTVDPDYDSPAVLARYAELYGADRERWLFLSGSREVIYGLARARFHLGVDEAVAPSPGALPEEPEAEGGEPFVHSTRFVLVDREGRIRGYYDSTDAARVRQLRADIESLLGEPPLPPPPA